MTSAKAPNAPFKRRRPLSERSWWDIEYDRFCHQMRLTRKWWLRPHTAHQPLFVIATCRSGSNLLLSYLNQQPNVRALGEILCPKVPIGLRQERVAPERAIKHIRYSLQGEKTAVRGCKLMLYQMANCQLDMNRLHAEFPDAKYIILYRQSLGEQYVSHQRAMATKQFLLLPGETQKDAELVIKPDELRAYCDHIRAGYHDVIQHRWLLGRSVLLSYEELVDDPDYWMGKEICPLLEVPYVGASALLCKQSTQPLSEQIANYKQVAALLNSPLCHQHHTWPWERNAKRRAA